jgi:hypothetical protein
MKLILIESVLTCIMMHGQLSHTELIGSIYVLGSDEEGQQCLKREL